MRTILITGANRGIGNAIAIQALKDGNRVSLGIRNKETLKQTKLDLKKYGKEKVFIDYYDALDNDSVKSWVKNTKAYFGKINGVIHCAGIFKNIGLNFPDKEFNELEQLWKVNLLGPWQLTKEIWKDLEDDGDARIQVLVSMSGKRSKGNLAGYTTSKFALLGLCQTIRNVGWDKGIRITAICPGWVNTDMSGKVKIINKEDMIQTSDIALLSSTLLKLPKSSVPFELQLNCLL